ncbi:DEAD/DEAH box helicase, partial [Vibrio cholerae]
MMVTFVSQCEKNALKKTRRVLDAFANRIGDNTWQTLITEEGLLTVKKMLRQTASRSTAVSCHWIRSRSRSQLLWVVGNKKKFNSEGIVPVNYTEKEVFMDVVTDKPKHGVLYANRRCCLNNLNLFQVLRSDP